MMLFKVYSSKTLQGTRTNISDSIIGTSNLGWKRGLDYGYVLPHPTLTTSPDLSVVKGDYIHIEIDDEIRFCTYIDEIEEPPDGLSKIIKCWDILKKLEDTSIKEFSTDSWFSSDSWWTGLSTAEQEELYYFDSSAGDQSTKRYISALFMIQVMMLECLEIDMRAAQVSSMNTLDSNFSINNVTPIPNGKLLFQYKQMRAIGSTANDDNNWDVATCLDVFHWIVRCLEIKFQYETLSGDIDYILSEYSTPSVPSADDGGYSPKDVTSYDGVTVKLTKLDDLYDYSSSPWTNEETDTENEPDDPTGGEKYKSITLPNHFVLHYKIASTSELVRFGGYYPFLILYAEVLEDIYTTEWKKKTFTMEAEEERDALEIKYKLSKTGMSADITYLDEVI